jgi:hypothetical protein
VNVLADHAADFTCIKGFNAAHFVIADHSIDFNVLPLQAASPFRSLPRIRSTDLFPHDYHSECNVSSGPSSLTPHNSSFPLSLCLLHEGYVHLAAIAGSLSSLMLACLALRSMPGVT